MNNQVERLQKELALAKSQALKEAWEEYLDKVKSFCSALVNRVILTEATAGRYVMYKVTGYEENYYADVNGYYGQFSPERWIELTTKDYLIFQVPNATIQSPHTAQHEFIFKKGSRIDIAKLDFKSVDTCTFGKRIIKFGYTEYKEYKESPDFDRALQNMMFFARVMPDNFFYEDARRVYLKHVEDTKNFWLKNEQALSNLQDLHSIYNSIKLN